MRNHFSEERMYTYLKGYASGRNWNETVKALNYARKLHKGQVRKSGQPYIIHPLTMACHAISLGVDEDDLIAAILYHDVVEDCGVSLNDLPCNATVKEAVRLLTYKKPNEYLEKDGKGPSILAVKTKYYNEIEKNKIASISKLFDRCHNVSSMAGTFTKEKLIEYIDETDMFILPLLRETKDNYPEYSNILFDLKYHIISVLDAINGTLLTFNIDISKEDKKDNG